MDPSHEILQRVIDSMVKPTKERSGATLVTMAEKLANISSCMDVVRYERGDFNRKALINMADALEKEARAFKMRARSMRRVVKDELREGTHVIRSSSQHGPGL